MDIDVFGDTGGDPRALLAGRELRANNLSNVFRLTDVWTRDDGRWQVVARHSSILG